MYLNIFSLKQIKIRNFTPQRSHKSESTYRTQHADILLLGSAAPKEGNYQDDGAQDDEANSRGLKLAIKELQVRAEEDLGDDPYRNQDDPGQLKFKENV